MPDKIYKRDRRLVDFRPEKISEAAHKAFSALKIDDSKILSSITKSVVAEISRKFYRKIPCVEDVQDIVASVLVKSGYERTAKAYSDYRKEREKIRDAKKLIGVENDDLKLGVNATYVLEKRYLLKDDDGDVIESPKKLFRRVARAVASAETIYGGDAKQKEEDFYRIMAELDFLPNSPTLMNAGTIMGQLSACFVLPIDDSIESIFTTLKHMAMIHQSGGGTGFSFSRLRPEGDIVSSTKCAASGPVSFMSIFDKATEVIKQGGRRRGANMGVLRVDHPDILQFITAKNDDGSFRNFNISVAITDKFMKDAEKGSIYELINPRTGRKSGELNAEDVFKLIVTMAWKSGDPGIIFIDEINRQNPTPRLGIIESTNPCGEAPLISYESCNLGSINLSRFVKEKKIDWARLESTVHLAVRFLDNCIDVNKFPIAKIEEATKATRKIGLGVMGFADLLIRLGVAYNSEKAVAIAEETMKFVSDTAIDESRNLAKDRGSFPEFQKSSLSKKYKMMRNASVTTVAPTGTISIIAGCSSGIEPLFGISFVRNIMGGAQMLETNPYFERTAVDKGFGSDELLARIAQEGTIQHMKSIPADVRKIFVTALDIEPEWHIKIQAAFQKHTDSAVSKTINFPATATTDDVASAFKLAHKLKCKGLTIYRYGSKKGQTLYFSEKEKYKSVSPEFSGGCPTTECPF